MLGRVRAADAKVQEAEAFRPVELTFVSSGRTAYAQSETAAEADGLADIAIDLRRMGVSGSQAASVLGDAGGARVMALEGG